MSRTEFMEQLERLLGDIPQEERIEALSYYQSYFEDAGIENEETIIRELESPEKVAKIIKADIGMDVDKEYSETGYEDMRFRQQQELGAHTGGYREAEYKEAEYKQEGTYTGSSTYSQNNGMNSNNSVKKEDRTLKIVLIVLIAVVTFPIWIGILGALVGVFFGIMGTVLGIIVSIVAVVFSLYVVGFVLAGVGIGMFPIGNFPAGIGLLGAGMIALALAVLGTILCAWLFGKLIPALVKTIVRVCRNLFRAGRKGQTV